MNEKHWYKCKYMVSPLGAAWCTKNDNWCKKTQYQDRMSEITDMLIDMLTPRCKECGANIESIKQYIKRQQRR